MTVTDSKLSKNKNVKKNWLTSDTHLQTMEDVRCLVDIQVVCFPDQLTSFIYWKWHGYSLRHHLIGLMGMFPTPNLHFYCTDSHYCFKGTSWRYWESNKRRHVFKCSLIRWHCLKCSMSRKCFKYFFSLFKHLYSD